MPQISIIVPNYNTEKYLPRCLKSLVNQTFKDIEIIVIDDGSKDDSVKIMRQFAEKDNRIKVITQKNSGPATARNKGLDAATGKYLMFCDSDDWYEPNMCEVMFNTIEKKKTDIVCCHNFFDYDENLPKSEDQKIIEFKKIVPLFCPNKKGKKKLTYKNIITTNVMLWNKIWRHDIIKQYKIRFPDGHEHDDNAMWYKYAGVAKNIYYLKKPLYHYFIRSGSIMSTQFNRKPKNRYDSIIIANYIADFYAKNVPAKQRKQKILYAYYTHLLYIVHSNFFSIQELEDLCETANQNLKYVYDIEAEFMILNEQVFALLIKKSYCFLVMEYILLQVQRHLFVKNATIALIKNKVNWQYRRQLRKNKKTKTI